MERAGAGARCEGRAAAWDLGCSADQGAADGRRRVRAGADGASRAEGVEARTTEEGGASRIGLRSASARTGGGVRAIAPGACGGVLSGKSGCRRNGGIV